MADPRRRDLALDLLRGYCLCVILTDHLRFAVNPLYYLSGHGELWVTAAEGFVLISGFLVGKLRGGQARARGLGTATRHLLRRAAVLALWCALLTIAYRSISEATGYWPAVPNADEPGSLLDWILGAAVLRKTYGDHNLLAVYALFMLAAPLGIYAMLRGRTVVFLLASGILWAAGYRFWLRWSNSVQADACWQFLFAIGMAIGFNEERLAARWSALPTRTRRIILGAAAVLSLAVLAVSTLRSLVPAEQRPWLENALWERNRLGPARVAFAILFVGMAYAYVRIFEERLVRTVGKVFIPLGQSSLYVYIVQSMLTFTFVNRTVTDPWRALAQTVALLGLVWIFVEKRVLFSIIPR
jgi:hypothetical protein